MAGGSPRSAEGPAANPVLREAALAGQASAPAGGGSSASLRATRAGRGTNHERTSRTRCPYGAQRSAGWRCWRLTLKLARLTGDLRADQRWRPRQRAIAPSSTRAPSTSSDQAAVKEGVLL